GRADGGEPLVGLRLLRRDLVADAVDQDLAAAARDRVEARVAQPRDRLPEGQPAPPRDVLHLGRRQRMQVDLVARLDRPEEILVVRDVEVGMVPALHQQAGAAECQRLLDLLEDHRVRQEVALTRVAWAAVERAELAVRVADVRVVEVAIDDERDARRVGLAVSNLVRGTPDRDEVAGLEQRQRLVVGDALTVAGLVEDRRNSRHATTASRTKRSSGTSSSSPASRASSRNVIRPARSRGPNRYRSFSKYRARKPAG